MGADGWGRRPAGQTISPDPALLHWADFEWCATHACIPVRDLNGALAYAAADPHDALKALAQKGCARPYRLIETPHQDIIDILNARFHDQLTDHAVSSLVRLDPDHCAASGLTGLQWAGGLSMAALLSLSAMINAPATLRLINFLTLALFVLLLAFRILILRQRTDAAPERRANAAPALQSFDLPVYTILVPMFHEAEMIENLVAALSRLTYPADRLDIKLILEQDDDETRAAVARQNLKQPFEIIIVPPSLPKTKPKACNYALKFARGSYVVIYDAEDRPESDQLMEAMRAFRRAPKNTVCLQAPLSFYNPDQNWLTRQFTIEYAVWFRVVLPALHALGLPIPLGGTSNHFCTDFLNKVGAWDPYNVTEDADLGMRIAHYGGACGVINSTTYEEANSRLGNWIRQRSRWQKGFCQTWAVHMRRPRDLHQALGSRGFCGFQLVIGGSILTGLATLLSLMLAGGQAILSGGNLSFDNFSAVQWANLALFATCLGVTALAAVKGLTRAGFKNLKLSILGMPIYWGLVCIAAVKGLWQLMFNPYYWEKTRHGLTPESPHDGAPADQAGPAIAHLQKLPPPIA